MLSLRRSVVRSGFYKTRGLPFINWEDVRKKIEPGKFSEIRAEVSQNLADLSSSSSEPVKIDWDLYAKRISTPGVVDKIKQAFLDAEAKDQEELNMDVKSKYLGKHLESELEEATFVKELAIKELENLEEKLFQCKKNREEILDLSLEEFWERFPHIREQVEKELNEENWHSASIPPPKDDHH